jgi:uncharacterized protein with GYD domain
MPKMLVKASYTAEGAKGLVKETGTGRRASVTKVVENLGGKVEAFYFAYGADDAIVIVDMPDETAGLALAVAVNASGTVHCTTVPLITPETMDAALKKTVGYRAPGA